MFDSTTIYDFDATTTDGSSLNLGQYRGAVVLVVNVASACGFTPQYRGLERLYRRHRDEGFVVLGFPCNQFGRQEPGSDDEIHAFCAREYDVTFPISSKVDVNGTAAHPLFKYLKARKKGVLGTESIKWNFSKFLVGRNGDVLARYGSVDSPESIEADIVRALAKTPPETRGASGREPPS